MNVDANSIIQVWIRGKVRVGWDPATWRIDDFGFWMKLQDYGNRDSEYGWEIDHITPVAQGGSDNIQNLRPLHWKSNLRRNSNYRM